MTVLAYAAPAADQPLGLLPITRREPGPHDVAIAIAWCGVCHSDLHTARNEWNNAIYPVVPGHEIVGHVTAVGAEVTKFKVGDTVGVGCMVDSCGHCGSCHDGLEQFCEEGMVQTYNSPTADAPAIPWAATARRSWSTKASCSTCAMPRTARRRRAAALRRHHHWSPRHWNVGPGKKVGIVGIGGLGHMGVKLARALGAHVVAFTTSPAKREEALALGAHEVVVSRDADEMAAQTGSLDFILDTVAASHNLDAFVTLLKRDGTLCLVGAPEHPHPSPTVFNLIFGRRSIAGSLIGGIAETQEMLDFCAEHGIVSEIETIAVQDINTAWDRMEKGDVRYRFVIDSSTFA
jgi:uncharacterized zinc-type alcohol dehydrogenase-like protein